MSNKCIKVDRDVYRILVKRAGKLSINSLIRKLLGFPPRARALPSRIRGSGAQ